jgi:hypothetical protein
MLKKAWECTLLVVFLFPLGLPAHAGVGTEGASFLDIPVGAGPAAMGSAYSALASNAYAPTWNPGGLGFVDSTQFAAQHLDYISPNHDEYLSFVQPLKPGHSLGASMQYWGSGDIPGTDLAGNPTGNFSSHYASYNLAYGQTLTDKLSLGVTGKWINAQIADVSANAYAADLGAIYKVGNNLTLATVLTNLGSKLTFLSEGDSLPLALHLGAAYQPNSQWAVSTEGVYEQSGLASGRVGLEWRPIQMIALRTGYRSDTLKGLSALAGLSTGVGLNMWGQELAYAWVPMGDLGNTQYFSLLMRFGDKVSERNNLIQYQSIKTHRTVRSNTTTPTGSAAVEQEAADPEYGS